MARRNIPILLFLVLFAATLAGCQFIPNAPRDLQALKANGAISLTWRESSNASSYKIYQSIAPGGPYAPVTAVSDPYFRVDDLTNGTTYYFVVTSCNEKGESKYSLEVNATPEDNDPPTITSASPENPAATSRTSASIGAVSFAVNATDPDGDVLTYEWVYSDGSGVPSNSPSFTWQPPLHGSYDKQQVSVLIRDGHYPPVKQSWDIEILDSTAIYHCTRIEPTFIPVPSPGTLTAGVHFPPDMLRPYLGRRFEHVMLYAASDGSSIPVNISICQDSNGVPGTAYCSFDSPFGLGSGITQIRLPIGVSIQITETTDLWVLVKLTNSISNFKLGCCPGPVVANGNWCKLNGERWKHLNEINKDYAGNWMIFLN